VSVVFGAALIDLWDTLAFAGWGRQMAALEAEVGVPSERIIRAFVDTRPARSIGAYADAETDLRAVLVAAGLDPSPEAVRRLVELEADFLTVHARLFDDALPVLRELRSRGVRTAVVSNCSHSTRPVVDRLRLAEEADAVVLSFEIGSAKPEPAIYLAALERLGVGAADAVFVDDQTEYCAGAAEVGLRAYLLRRTAPGQSPIEGLPTDAAGFPVISGLTDLLALT
jgi:putative hydrolase of the HAD superfamily